MGYNGLIDKPELNTKPKENYQHWGWKRVSAEESPSIPVADGIVMSVIYCGDVVPTLLLCFSDVYIDVPDTIDISHMRSKGLQPGEELLPEAGLFGL